MRIRKKQKGFSFIELMIGMFVFAIGMLGVIQGFYIAQKMTDKTVAEFAAFRTAQHYLTQLNQQPLTDEQIKSGELKVVTPTGQPITLYIGDPAKNKVLIDFYDTPGHATDDIEMYLNPIISAPASSSLGDLHEISLAYKYKTPSGQFVGDALKTSRAKALRYIDTTPKEPSLRLEPTTVVVKQQETTPPVTFYYYEQPVVSYKETKDFFEGPNRPKTSPDEWTCQEWYDYYYIRYHSWWASHVFATNVQDPNDFHYQAVNVLPQKWFGDGNTAAVMNQRFRDLCSNFRGDTPSPPTPTVTYEIHPGPVSYSESYQDEKTTETEETQTFIRDAQ